MNRSAGNRLSIVVNGEAVAVAEAPLEQILIELGYDLTHAAVALNEAVVFRQDLPGATVHDGDRVEVVAPMSGG